MSRRRTLFDKPPWDKSGCWELFGNVPSWTPEQTEEHTGASMRPQSTPIALPVVLSVAVTFLQMLVDEDTLSGWQGAAAKGILTLLKRFSSGGGSIPKLASANVLQSLPPTSEHDAILKDFPTNAITPRTVQVWGEALASAEQGGDEDEDENE